MSSGAGMTVVVADCIEHMRTLPEHSIDAVVCDPPYALSFMGKAWDRYSAREFEDWCASWAAECLRALKPGGHLLAFGGTRTYHRLAAGIEDAGFEVRDCLAWMYGSGFPKSLDVSKAIDKRPGVERHRDFAAHLAERRAAAGMSRADVSEHVVGSRSGACWNWEHHQFPEAKWWPALRDLLALDESWGAVVAETERRKIGEREGNLFAFAPGQEMDRSSTTLDITEASTSAAAQWQGWGTALKPAFEPVVVARKPLVGTVAANVLLHGTGALNIDGCRVDAGDGYAENAVTQGVNTARTSYAPAVAHRTFEPSQEGRWPANVMLDEEAAGLLDEQTGDLHGAGSQQGPQARWDSPGGYGGGLGANGFGGARIGDTGGASRFFLTVSPDTLCVLCALPCAPTATDHSNLSAKNSGSAVGPVPASGPRDSEDKSAPSTGPANTVGQASSTTPATVKGVTARTDAQAKLAARIVQLARSAESLCDSCATATAQSVAATLHDPTQGSHPGPVSTRERRQRILSRSLALIAAGWESTGITPTTAALSSSFGSALHVTESDTAESSSEFDRTRFRYQSKASSAERNAGLDGLPEREREGQSAWAGRCNVCECRMMLNGKPTCGHDDFEWVTGKATRNVHPTVKPVELMRWLIRLVTPPGGTVLDPFTGSGTTGVAAHLEGVEFLGIEREPEYAEIARARIEWWRANTDAGAPTDAVLKVDRDPAQLNLLGGEAA